MGPKRRDDVLRRPRVLVTGSRCISENYVRRAALPPIRRGPSSDSDSSWVTISEDSVDSDSETEASLSKKVSLKTRREKRGKVVMTPKKGWLKKWKKNTVFPENFFERDSEMEKRKEAQTSEEELEEETSGEGNGSTSSSSMGGVSTSCSLMSLFKKK